jgi:hypothetical protein
VDSWLVGAALSSAALHAAWNAAVRARPQPAKEMTARMLASAGLAFPALIRTGPAARPSVATTWRRTASTRIQKRVVLDFSLYENHFAG